MESKFNLTIFAFCILAALLIFPAPRPVSANTGESDAGSEFRDDKIELTPMEKMATELTYSIGNKLADLLDEIAASVESRTERKKSREKGENYVEGAPDGPEDGPSEKAEPLPSGFAKIFSLLMREAAHSVREYLEENVLPKLPPKDLLVKIPPHSYHAVA